MLSEKPDLTVTILGSGTCVPSLQRSSCAVMIDTGSAKLLLDSGPGTMHRLLETGTTIFDIDYIFYSHFHPDHSAELVPFLFATKYPDSQQRRNLLTVAGGRGFINFYNKLKAVYGRWIELEPGRIAFDEFDNRGPDRRAFQGFSVSSAPVDHNDESIAYRVTGPNGGSVVYSGDTGYSERLVALAENADLLICECAMPDGMPVKGHLTPSRAGRIATEAGVQKLILTHFYPACDQADIEKECRRAYAGPLVLAEDLMCLEVP